MLSERASRNINVNPTIRTPAEGRTIAVVGDVYRFLTTGEDTNGKYAMWEAIVPPGGGPRHGREPLAGAALRRRLAGAASASAGAGTGAGALQLQIGLLRGLRDAGATVVVTTEDAGAAAGLVDRVVQLDRGRIVADGTACRLAASA